MNILLIYPKFPDTFWSFTYALSFIGKKAAFPPLGLITVAALMPASWSKRLVDLNVDSLTDKDLSWADMAFISGMAVQRNSAQEIIARCAGLDLTVVAGGPLFTAEPDLFGEVDHLVLDEGEVTLPAFLSDLQDGHPQKIYRASNFCDIGDTPAPSWDLVNTRRYAAMNIQFSRGCPFNCEFCNVTELFGHRPRMKTPEQIIAELDRIYATGWRSSIFFVDDNFIGNKGYLKTYLLPALIEWRQNKTGCVFLTEASINIADDTDLMDMMVKAGFDSVFIGIESPDEVSLAECRKTHNTHRDLLTDVKRIHRSGCRSWGDSSSVSTTTHPRSFNDRSISFRKAASSRPWWACSKPRRGHAFSSGSGRNTALRIPLAETMLMERPISSPAWASTGLAQGINRL